MTHKNQWPGPMALSPSITNPYLSQISSLIQSVELILALALTLTKDLSLTLILSVNQIFTTTKFVINPFVEQVVHQLVQLVKELDI